MSGTVPLVFCTVAWRGQGRILLYFTLLLSVDRNITDY
jgi:hypothetical protein